MTVDEIRDIDFDKIRTLPMVPLERAAQAFQSMSTYIGKTFEELCESAQCPITPMVINTEIVANDNIQNLIKLILENPGIPVVPLVKSEVVCGNEYSHWYGNIGKVEIEKIYSVPGGAVYCYSDCELEEVLCEAIGYTDYDEIETEEEERTAFENLPWRTVIVVYIEPRLEDGVRL